LSGYDRRITDGGAKSKEVFVRIAPIASLLLGLWMSAGSALAEGAKPARTVTYTGRIATTDGKPVAGAEVILTTTTENFDQTAIVARTKSGNDGSFAFRDQAVVPDRPKQAVVRAEGYGLAVVKVLPDEENEVTLSPTTSLRVILIGPDGKVAPGVEIGLSSLSRRSAELDIAEPLPPEMKRSLGGRTDGQGVIELRGLPERAIVRLETSDARFARLGYEDNVETRDGPVSPPATVRLRAGGSMSGTVSYADSGKPAAGVEVTAQSLNLPRAAHSGWGHAVTDASGAYRMEQVDEGDYNVMLGTNSDAFRRAGRRRRGRRST